MQVKNMKQKSAMPHNFAMIPKADIPRSAFPISHNVKMAFSFSYLVPILVEEVLPGDLWKANCTIVARTATPIVPVMDNWHMETFFFFVGNRLVWDNWIRQMGEQDNPADGTSYTTPQCVSPAGGYPIGSLQDYMGLPTVGQVAGANTVSHNVLPLRAYNLIWNQWFRDENLQNSLNISSAGITNPGDGPDNQNLYTLQVRGKRPDYFTQALPFVQKGTAVSIPLGSTAPVTIPASIATGNSVKVGVIGTSNARQVVSNTAGVGTTWGALAANTTDLFADLSQATAATINQLRQSFQIQKLLERDARGGSRYTEIVRQHFGVVSPDARFQRPEYLGGGHIPILTSAIPQTSSTGLTGATTPMGTLAAIGHAQGNNGFTYSATEHGWIIGLVSARADQTYQQGMHKKWSRLTRFDYYWPAFAMLGEQAVTNREIYCDGSANDALTFGYQERWAEYRYMPNRIAGIYRSTASQTLDLWHSAQKFAALPTLAATFIQDDSKTVVQRNFALGATSLGQQLLADILFTGSVARCMPTYSVPGLIDHF